MNISKWIEDIITSDKSLSMPIMTHPGIELLGKKVLDAVTDGEVHFQAIHALNERFPQAMACTAIMDLTVEAEAFGSQLCMSEHEVPTVTGRLLTSFEEVNALQIPSLDSARVPQYLKANAMAAAGINKPVFAGCIGPYSLAGRLFDMTEIMMAIYTEPQTATLLLEKCTEFLLSYCQAIKATGVAGVVMAEPAAGLLSDEDCFHNCGNTGHCTPAMLKTGAKGYHFGNKADMVEALKVCPADVLVMGNLDPVGIFKMALPEVVVRQTEELLNRTSSYPNFVISSGCDTPPEVPFANIEAFYQAVETYNNKCGR